MPITLSTTSLSMTNTSGRVFTVPVSGTITNVPTANGDIVIYEIYKISTI